MRAVEMYAVPMRAMRTRRATTRMSTEPGRERGERKAKNEKRKTEGGFVDEGLSRNMVIYGYCGSLMTYSKVWPSARRPLGSSRVMVMRSIRSAVAGAAGPKTQLYMIGFA